MRKIFLFLAVLLSLTMYAESSISFGSFYAWGDGLKVKDNVVTTDAGKAWSGAQIWLGRDMSAYDYIWLEISECTGAFAVYVNYSEGTDSYVEINAGSDQLIAIALDPTRKVNVNKVELKNRDAVAATMTIQGVYAGTEAQLNAAWEDFRTALDFQYFSAWYGASFADMALTLTENYGTGSWWSVGDKSDYKSVVVNFASATAAGGNVTVTYEGSATKSQKDFYDGTTTVEVALDGTLKSNIGQIYVQGGLAGSTYTFASAYLMKASVAFPTNREDVTNLGQFKAYNDGLDVSGNTITWNDDKSWKGGDSWIGQDLRGNDYVWMLMDVVGQIKLTLQYGDGTDEVMEVYEGAPYVGFRLNAAKEQVAKLMAQNMTDGGKLVIKGLYVGSEAEYTAMVNRYTTSMNWSDFGNRWNANVNGKTFQMTDGWGAAGWWFGEKDYSLYTKVIAEFDGPAAISGNLVVAYVGAPNSSVRFEPGAHRVEIALDAEKKNKIEQIYFSCETTETNITLKEVRLVKVSSTEVALNQESDNMSTLIANNGFTCNVTLNREFKDEGYWYTLCLPFDLTAEQVAASLGKNCTLMVLDHSSLVGEEKLDIQFATATSVRAGVPYLYMPGEDKSSLSFENVIIDATEPTAYPAGAAQLATMTGTYGRPKLSATDYVLTKDNTLAPADGESWLRGFRAYFNFSSSVPAGVRARVITSTSITTDIEDVSTDMCKKMLIHGQMVIVKDNKMYNLQGARLQ